MASTGHEKYKKYFEGINEIEVSIVKNDAIFYRENHGSSNIGIINYGSSIMVYPEDNYKSRYKVKYDNNIGYVSDKNIGKPHNKILVDISSSEFIELGMDDKIYWDDDFIKVKRFDSIEDLKDSIIYGLNKNNKISEENKSSIINFFKSDKLEWKTITQEIIRLGIYLGELLVVYDWKFLNEDITSFYIPLNSNTNGIDSFVKIKNKIVAISSKLNSGAAASFFTNILTDAKIVYNNTLGKFVNICKDLNITSENLKKYRGQKEILYEYGICNLLNIKLDNSCEIFHNIKNNNFNDDTNKVIEKIRSSSDKLIKQYLPHSVTAFFSRSAATELNKDSLSSIYEILSRKNYWQASLNKTSWKNGILEYNIFNVKNSKITVIGNKSATNDLSSKQGMINYVLKSNL